MKQSVQILNISKTSKSQLDAFWKEKCEEFK